MSRTPKFNLVGGEPLAIQKSFRKGTFCWGPGFQVAKPPDGLFHEKNKTHRLSLPSMSCPLQRAEECWENGCEFTPRDPEARSRVRKEQLSSSTGGFPLAFARVDANGTLLNQHAEKRGQRKQHTWKLEVSATSVLQKSLEFVSCLVFPNMHNSLGGDPKSRGDLPKKNTPQDEKRVLGGKCGWALGTVLFSGPPGTMPKMLFSKLRVRKRSTCTRGGLFSQPLFKNIVHPNPGTENRSRKPEHVFEDFRPTQAVSWKPSAL